MRVFITRSEGSWGFSTVLCLMGCVVVVTGYAGGGQATPVNMEKIVIGRCEEFQSVIRPELFLNKRKNCTDLWVKFQKAFAYKDACDVTVENYKDFIAAAHHEVDTENRVMYWSGAVYPLVVDFARLNSHRYTTIREILAAYVIRNIEQWCGQVTPPGLNHQACPAWKSCPHLATSSFWTALSKDFAKQVKGTVHLMLNGSSGSAYLNTSIFAHSELKNLDASRTPRVHVHLVYTLKGPIRETCKTGTLVTLRQDVEMKHMTFKCTDDDQDIIYFQCVTEMGTEKCKSVGSKRNGALPLAASGQAMVLILLMTSSLLLTISLSVDAI